MQNKLTQLIRLSLFLIALLPLSGIAQEVTPGVWVSRNGEFRLSLSSEIEPIASGIQHEWILYIRTANRAPVTNATIEVHGYHPATRQILQRSPIIGPHIGGGAYEVYNMYFDQSGKWEVNIVVSSGSTVDAVFLPLELP